ncbi:unannotated protein [freshwater metagenome]|uniref:Unannotated protein n=1 Tax=freshwater metagenome TaxID=449393 RepID=A0A6J7JZC9_9ZZZZ
MSTQSRHRISYRDAHLAHIEEGMVVLGVPDPDRAVPGDSDVSEGLE